MAGKKLIVKIASFGYGAFCKMIFKKVLQVLKLALKKMQFWKWNWRKFFKQFAYCVLHPKQVWQVLIENKPQKIWKLTVVFSKKILCSLRFWKWDFKLFYNTIVYCVTHPKQAWHVVKIDLKRFARWSWATLPRRMVATVLIALTVFLPISNIFLANQAQAAWWDDSWMYRKPITITNSSGGTLTDYQVKILDNANLATLVGTGKLQTSLNDLRFTDDSGNLLSFWVEDATNSAVKAWVKIPSLTTAGATVYMYYGKATAPSVSDGNNTFAFFDDFDDASIDTGKWNIVNATGWSETGGTLHGTSTTGRIQSIATFSAPFQMATRHKTTTFPANGYETLGTQLSTSNAFGGFRPQSDTVGYTRYDSTWSASFNPSPVTFTSYHTARIWADASNNAYARLEQGANSWQANYTNTISSEPITLGERYDNANTGQTYSGDWDWIFVRKYASTEPVAGTPGREEKGSAPSAYWKFDEGTGTMAHDSITGSMNFGKGGTITDVGGYRIHTFLSSDVFIPPSNMNVEVVVVGGGGGGGGNDGGGGGAGGYFYESNHAVVGQQSYGVTVGSGGAGAAAGSYNGVAGNNSIFDNITANGGGYGGGGSAGYIGGDGGSGGGAAGSSSTSASGGATNQSGHGFAGGNNSTGSKKPGGGGGGSGSAGVNGNNASNLPGNGGNGTTEPITSRYLAGGGGGGGAGASVTSYGQAGGGNGSSVTNGTSATANTGSGGGGGMNSTGAGGAGGSGIVIIRYPFPDNNGTLNNMASPATSTSGWQNGTNCVSGKCLAFDGTNDFVSFSTNNVPAGSSARTISMWINPTSVSIDNVGLFGYGTESSNQSFSLSTCSGADANKIKISKYGTDATCSTGTLSVGSWQYVTVTLDGSGNVAYYINGKNAGTATLSGVNTVTNGTGYIGKASSSGTTFNGKIDEVKAYSSVLSSNKIAQNYNIGVGGVGAANGSGASMGGRQMMDDSWWNKDWSYRKSVSIANSSGGTLTDFQVGITMDTASLIAAGKMQSDCGDILITDSGGNTTFPYWIESSTKACNTATTKIWIKEPSIPTTGTSVYIYYGNSSASYSQEPNSIFPLFGSDKFVYYWDRTDGYMGWWQAPTSSCGNWNMIGGYGLFGFDYYPFVWMLSELPAATYRVNFKFYKIDSWDSETATFTWNSTAVWSQAYTGAAGSQICGTATSGYNESETDVSTTLVHAGGYTSSWFSSTLNEAMTNESYGFNDFFLRKYSAIEPVATVGAEEDGINPSAYWKFDEGQGIVVNDSISNFNNGGLSTVTQNYSTSGAYTWTAPSGVTSATVKLWGGGGSGAGSSSTYRFGGGGAGGQYVEKTVSVNPGAGYSVVVAGTQAGGTAGNSGSVGNDSTFASTTVVAKGGAAGLRNATVAAAGSTSGGVGDIVYAGGDGGYRTSGGSGGGGGGAGTTGAGGNASGSTAGTGTSLSGGDGGAGRTSSASGNSGVTSGGGGGGAYSASTTGYTGGTGAQGYATISYSYENILTNMASPATSTSGWQNGSNCLNGKCLAFDGTNDYIDLNTTNFPSGSNARTISMWINPASVAVDNMGLFGYGTETASQSLYVSTCTGANANKIKIGKYGTDASCSTGTISANIWQHITVTLDGSGNVAYYINGKNAGTATLSGVNTVLSNGYIGKASSSGTTFNGKIDEVKVYPYAMNAIQVSTEVNLSASLSSNAQVGANLSAGTASEYCVPGDASACNSPIAEWKMDENTGTTANDTSGNNNTGTLTSGPTWVPGKYGSGVNFIGTSSNYINQTNSVSGVKTVSFWAKPSTTTQSFLQLASGVSVTSSTGTVSAGGFTAPTIYVNGVVSGTVSANTWNYITVTTGTGVTSNAIKFGLVGSTYYTGALDQIRLYDYARTPAQIAWEYNRGGPVGWWKMDECAGTTIYDASGNVYNGTWSGSGGAQTTVGTCNTYGTAWGNGASGKFGSSLKFDGTDDYVNQSTSISGVQTVSFWAKPSTTSQSFLQLASGISVTSSSGTVSAGGFSSPTIYVNGVSGASVFAGNWNHIVVTTGTGITANAIKLGLVGSTYYSGQLDDVRIYNYILTENQIATVMNDGSALRFGSSGIISTNSNKTISSFYFSSPYAVGSIDQNAKTISVTVPIGTSLTSLTPSIAYNGLNISPSSGVAQNFTNPVNYTVTASDSSTQDYVVTVMAEAVPVNTAVPTISGTATVGSMLTATTGTWTGWPTPTFTYQWQRGTSNISGATNSTYTAQSADAGSTLRVVVTGTNSVGNATGTSANTSAVTMAPSNTAVPTISGRANVGQTLTATTGTWTGYPTPTYTYQWQRGTSDIGSATNSTYVVQAGDLGSTLRVVVTATNSVGNPSANSANTATVLAAIPSSVTVSLWGGGGAGGGALGALLFFAGGGGGAGGQYAEKVVSVTSGQAYTVVRAASVAGSSASSGSNGNDSYFYLTSGSNLCMAKGGQGGTMVTYGNGVGGTGSTTGGIGDVVYRGGNGANGSLQSYGGGGGGSAGTGGNGGNASGTTAGTGTASSGGNGGAGKSGSGDGSAGSNYGGGGGAGSTVIIGSATGGAGAQGYAEITYPDTYADAFSTTGSPTYTNTGGYKTYKWTTAGTGSITF